MAESTLKPPSGFEQGTPGLGIQHLNHYAIVPRPLANFNGSKQIQIDLKSFATTIWSKLLSVIPSIKTVFEEIVTTVQQTAFTNYLSHFKHFTMTRSPFISWKGFC